MNEYGLSEDRLYATAFMLYLAGLFGWLAWTTLRGARRRFAFGGLVQGFAMLGVLHLVNPDVLIVRTNLARPAAERPFDGWYAASLSADVVPVTTRRTGAVRRRRWATSATGAARGRRLAELELRARPGAPLAARPGAASAGRPLPGAQIMITDGLMPLRA